MFRWRPFQSWPISAWSALTTEHERKFSLNRLSKKILAFIWMNSIHWIPMDTRLRDCLLRHLSYFLSSLILCQWINFTKPRGRCGSQVLTLKQKSCPDLLSKIRILYGLVRLHHPGNPHDFSVHQFLFLVGEVGTVAAADKAHCLPVETTKLCQTSASSSLSLLETIGCT